MFKKYYIPGTRHIFIQAFKWFFLFISDVFICHWLACHCDAFVLLISGNPHLQVLVSLLVNCVPLTDWSEIKSKLKLQSVFQMNKAESKTDICSTLQNMHYSLHAFTSTNSDTQNKLQIKLCYVRHFFLLFIYFHHLCSIGFERQQIYLALRCKLRYLSHNQKCQLTWCPGVKDCYMEEIGLPSPFVFYRDVSVIK